MFAYSTISSTQTNINNWLEEGYKEEKIFLENPDSSIFIKEIIKEMSD